MTRLPQFTYRRFCLAFALTLPLVSHAKSNATLPLDEIRNFVDVYNVIKHEYVEEKDGKTLIDFAIEGMLNGLDPHSMYLKKAQLEDFQETSSGSYVGFGFQLDIVNGLLMIVSPIPNSPAEKAGLKPNDRIVKINKTLIENMSMIDIDGLLNVGDSVDLTISRAGEKTKVVKLERTKIDLPSVNAKILDKNYGYIRVTQFQDNTAAQFQQSLDKQLTENVKGVIIDLRNNPGGLVHAATAIADNFLAAGLIVSTKNPNTGSEEKVHAQTESTLAKELPLVVLINEGSASASELLAGALQSHKRALIVGQASFGKGSVQNLIPLSNGDAIKLTTARYYTPSGQSIQAKGITPDIELSQLTVDEKDVDLLSYSESDIAGHLPQKSTPKSGKNGNKKDNDSTSGTALAKSDLQLFEALNVLKVMTLTR